MTVKELRIVLKDQPDDAEVFFVDPAITDKYEHFVRQEIHGVSRTRRAVDNGAVYLWNV